MELDECKKKPCPARGLCCLLTWSAAVLGMWKAEWGFPHVSGLDTIVVGAIRASSDISSSDISKSSVQRAALGGATSEQAPGSAVRLLGGPLCHPQPRSQGREHCRVPARPAGVFLARPAPAPACLLPRLPGRLPLGELLPVLPGVWRCQRVGESAAPVPARFGPARKPLSAARGLYFKTFSRPTHIHHPSPLAASGCS